MADRNIRSGEASNRGGYAGKVAIRHAVAAARDNGIDIGGVELTMDGTIRIVDIRSMPKQPLNDFDRLEQQGLL